MPSRSRRWWYFGLPAMIIAVLLTFCGLAVARAADGSCRPAERDGVLVLCAAYGAWSTSVWLLGATNRLASDRIMASWPGIWLPLAPALCVVGPALCSPAVRIGLVTVAQGSHPAWLLSMQSVRVLSISLIFRWRSGHFSHMIASRFALFDFAYGAATCALLLLLVVDISPPRRALGLWHALGLWALRGTSAIGEDLAYEAASSLVVEPQHPPTSTHQTKMTSLSLSRSAVEIIAVFRDLSMSQELSQSRLPQHQLHKLRTQIPKPRTSAFVSSREVLRSPLVLGLAALLPLLLALNVLAASVYLVDGERTRTHPPYKHRSNLVLEVSSWANAFH